MYNLNKVLLVDLDDYKIAKDNFDGIDMKLMLKYKVFPFDFKENQVSIAAYQSLTMDAVRDLKFILKKEIVIFKGDKTQIENYINIYSSIKLGQRAIQDIKMEKALDKSDKNIENINGKYIPTVCLADSIICLALTKNASDIHIEPFKSIVHIRIRVDGILTELMEIPKEAYESVLIRIKIKAKMNITIKKNPQDGRIEYNNNGVCYDFRVSTMPTIFGEKIVMRILYKEKSLLTFEEVTYDKKEEILKIIDKPNGIILISGPTGSGKTTTLYSILSKINTLEKNIVTIEDPVEILMDRVNQINVNSKIGLTFAVGLKTILRQDPDIVMVGEIRDEETAQIAVRAAITGHLVLSTIHTNDTFSAISRLRDMGIERYLISDALSGVVAQRLVRKICKHCKEEYEPNFHEMEILNLKPKDKLFRGRGCAKCNYTGYAGRKAVFEVMSLDEESRHIINSTDDLDEIKKYFIKKGTKLLKNNAYELVVKGETTFNEVVKIVDGLG